MARQVSVQLVDDIDGSPAAETVDFGLDGVRYTIDLSRENAAQLRSVLAPYLRRARALQASAGGGKRRRRRAAADSTALIRDLAERARSQRRTEDATEPQRDGQAAGATGAAEEITGPVLPEPVTPAEPDARPVTPPLAPVFQPPQR
ncbi:histone-like nucleoid-structuring protein Lsr2 [Gandjariella thermophila]|uniref:Lsr2 family protein n=1 Tax=Gandjariella thermophila TaxID=1931992 RepID=A0A4D4IXV2_9PSEU|nr:Lsr2 family protein [Gandjariella thermophila]GDY29051.1 Lsr2 family protein [Gandjariella thermophila]